jgi:organic radical activating enzyme
MTKTFCHLPFVHFALNPDGLAKPCCRFATYARGEQELRNWWNVNHNNIGSKNVLNSDEFASVREAMIEGKEVPGCWKCHNEEKTVGYSMRTFYNNKFLNHDRSVKLKYLEVGFGNYCNLSCRTCSSELSTSWYEDDVKLSKKYEGHAPHKKIIDIPFNWKSEDFEYIEEIKFVGGEPMLNPNFNKFLKTVLDTGNGKNIKLNIYTNSSWFPKKATVDLLKEFENVFIWLSIDAYSKLNDYIRNGSNWETLSKSALNYLDLEKESTVFSIMLTPTLNILNVSQIYKLVDWWVNARNERNLSFRNKKILSSEVQFGSGDIIFSKVYNPDSLNIKHYPNKIDLINFYKNIVSFSNNLELRDFYDRTYHKIIKMLEQEINEKVDLISFIQFTKDLDLLRNQNFKEILPELYNDITIELAKDNLTYEGISGKL